MNKRDWDMSSYPLNSEGNLIPPLISPIHEAAQQTTTDKLTDDPAQVHIGSQVMPHGNWTNFGSIGRCHGLEDTPTNAAERLADCEDGETLREERNEDESNQASESNDECPPIAVPLAEEASQLQADDLTTVRSACDPVLPAGRDVQAAVLGLDAVLGQPGGIRLVVARDGRIVALHYKTGREDDAPHHGLGVNSECRAKRHVALASVGFIGLADKGHEVFHVTGDTSCDGVVDLA